MPLFVEDDVTGAAQQAFTLPTGTVTFLMSDVEGSTRRWEDAPRAMAEAIPRHYELLDAAIVSHGGVRPVEQGEGDSVVGAFSRASDAVAAALAAQRAMATEHWPPGAELRVRIAVHTGEAQLGNEGSYLGQTLGRCARIRSAGHGGQVLLSQSSAALVADRLPLGATLDDLGMHRLRDLGRPERIWQLIHADLPSQFPPLFSLDEFRHNLPVQLTPLVGRSGEIADTCRLLAGDRLVTLTGSAGVGKTRLALAVAAEMLDAYPGGVWWVELAALTDPGAVGRAALAALSVDDVPGVGVVRQLAVEFGDQPSMLVLDNCEHLLVGCAELVAELLSASPSTSVLTTSREPLGVPGEITWRVPSMRCPNLEPRPDLSSLSQYDAVVLFVERARRARPSFAVSEANASAVAQICHRLDGIPLAIELAAARCRQMSAERIAAELDDRFRLLTGGARTVMARQQTLAASLDWSHDRLDNLEQTVFMRVGVFTGLFPLEAAESVVASVGDADPVAVFDVISRLVDKSLVVAEEGPRGQLRYRLLETLRAYAIDRARVADELTILRDAHATWWADWLEPRGAMPTDDVLEEIDEFHANLTNALNWSADRPLQGLRLLRGVALAWKDLGRAADAMAAADRLLTDANAARFEAEWLGAAYHAAGLYLRARGPKEFGDLLERVENVAGRLDNDYYRCLARWRKDTPDVIAAVRDQARERGDRYVEAWATIAIASDLAWNDPVGAAPALDNAQAVAEASGMRYLRDAARFAHADAALAHGDLAAAIELAKAVLASASATYWSDAVRNLSIAGLLADNEGALRIAVNVSDRELRTSPGLGQWTHTARHRLELLEGAAAVVDPNVRDPTWRWPSSPGTLWLNCRETIDAGTVEAAIDHARGWTRPEPHARAVLAALEAAATGDESRWHTALAIAVEKGLRLIAVDALEGLATAAAQAESWNECLRLVGAAQRLRDETGYRWRFGFEKEALDTARTNAAEALGDEGASAYAEGTSTDWRTAAAYASRARGERKRPHHGWASLTPTEHQVVMLVAEGLTNPQIAGRLLMGRATVKTHLEHIFTKLGVRTRAELAGKAAQRRNR